MTDEMRRSRRRLEVALGSFQAQNPGKIHFEIFFEPRLRPLEVESPMAAVCENTPSHIAVRLHLGPRQVADDLARRSFIAGRAAATSVLPHAPSFGICDRHCKGIALRRFRFSVCLRE